MAPVPGTKWLRCSTSAAMRSSDKRLCYRPLLAEADVIIAPVTSRVSRIAGWALQRLSEILNASVVVRRHAGHAARGGPGTARACPTRINYAHGPYGASDVRLLG